MTGRSATGNAVACQIRATGRRISRQIPVRPIQIIMTSHDGGKSLMEILSALLLYPGTLGMLLLDRNTNSRFPKIDYAEGLGPCPT